jgi:hypothetical protein
VKQELQDNGSDKREPEIIDGQTGLVCPTPRTINLSNHRGARLELAHVYREIDAGWIKSQDGTRRAYVLRQIADILVSAEQEKPWIPRSRSSFHSEGEWCSAPACCAT